MCSPISPQEDRNAAASRAARAQLKLGDEGVLFQKEERETELGSSSSLCHSFSDRFSSSPPVLGPSTTSPLRRTCDTNSVAFLGFFTANQITLLLCQLWVRVQISQICFATCNQSICSPASRGSWLMFSPYLLFLEDLFIVKETFHSYFSREEFSRGVVIKYVCSAILNNSCFTSTDFQLGSKVTGIWFQSFFGHLFIL